MRTQGCGLTCAIVCLFLSACQSSQSALESRITEDLEKVLNSTALKKELSRKLTSTRSDSRMLNEAHVEMYVLVRARAMQLRGLLTESSTNQVLSASKQPEFATEKQGRSQSTEKSAAIGPTTVDIDPEISPEELTALNELDLSQDLYAWVKQTVEVTVEFVGANVDPAIFEIVTLHDPVIKHNISIVENFQERLSFAYSGSLQVSQFISTLEVTPTHLSAEAIA